jgi:hypothetical protein
MIRYLFWLLEFSPRLSLPAGFAPVPLIRQGRISGVRAAKRLAHKHHNRRRSRHA